MEKQESRLKLLYLFDHPEIENIDDNDDVLLILDDTATLAPTTEWVKDYFIRKSHHNVHSIIAVYHGLFVSQIPFMRQISLNSQITLFTQSHRSLDQVQNFGRQVFTYHTKKFLHIYKDATQGHGKYGYLCVNLQPNYNPLLRLMTRFIPPDDTPTVYEMLDQKK